MSAPDLLTRITDAVRARLQRDAADAGLEEAARAAAASRGAAGRRSLRAALGADGVRVIAECKRRSPSKGWLRQPFDAVELARAYEAGGAAAISVVTEPEFFAGEPRWVAAVRGAVSLPVLQKDFLLDPRQLFEAVLRGADAVLLIARVLPGAQLGEMLSVAGELGLETLVEVHDSVELDRVLELDAPVVGVNARDLATFQVDFETAAGLARRVPPGRTAVVESGVSSADAVRRLVAAGVRRFLVGEHLLRSSSPAAALAELIACA